MDIFSAIRRMNLDETEKTAFGIHLVYQGIEGVVLGVLAMNEYVFIKSLQGSNYQLSILFQFSVIIFVFLVFFNEIRKRIRNKRKMLRIAAIITRAPLFLLPIPMDGADKTKEPMRLASVGF